VFDALTHERPYKSAWPVDMAVDEITSNRGTQFDPEIVDAFSQLDATGLVNPPEPVPGAVGFGDRPLFDRSGGRLTERLTG
jgi:putative two-component system response regulator